MDITRRETPKPAPPTGTVKRAGRGWYIISDSEDETPVNTTREGRHMIDAGDDAVTSEPAFGVAHSKESGSTGNQAMPQFSATLLHLSLDQRIKYFTLDPLADSASPQSVSCRICHTTLPLRKGRQYDLEIWNNHCIELHGRTRFVVPVQICNLFLTMS